MLFNFRRRGPMTKMKRHKKCFADILLTYFMLLSLIAKHRQWTKIFEAYGTERDPQLYTLHQTKLLHAARKYKYTLSILSCSLVSHGREPEFNCQALSMTLITFIAFFVHNFIQIIIFKLRNTNYLVSIVL